jgi:probable HAF family extracellular repeat protein
MARQIGAALLHSRPPDTKGLNIAKLLQPLLHYPQATSQRRRPVKSRRLTCITAMIWFATLAMPIQLAAQHTRYKLVDLGTLGGPSAYQSVNAPGYQIINNAGTVAFGADTPMTDPNAPNPSLCYQHDCFVSHATRWNNGVLTDLGALPGVGNGSQSGAINARGWITGQSENGEIDPLSGLPEVRAVLWKDDAIPIDLGTFGGNYSLGITLNNLGQVVGFAANTIPDPSPMFPGGTQSRAFLWQDGVLQDLGTLGGPDAQALSINERGQVAGVSYTDPNETINPTTGMPTSHPFLWDHGIMTDLGTLGGTLSGEFLLNTGASSLLVNNRGQVIGQSTLAGDQVVHPFLWSHGVMRDLGTLGGDNGAPVWLTDNGQVVGDADLPGSQHHDAFLWRNGVMTDLGNLGGNSAAFMMNSRGQIVGISTVPPSFNCAAGDCIRHAFLWENGQMLDLNDLVPPSNMVLHEADNINERGEIVAWALPAGCNDRDLCGQIVLLVPCDHGKASTCESADVNTVAADLSNPTSMTDNVRTSAQVRPTPRGILAGWRSRLYLRYQLPSVTTPKD